MRASQTVCLLATLVGACSARRPGAPSVGPSTAESVRRSFHGHEASHADGSVYRNWADTIRLGEDMQLSPISTHHLRFAYPPEKIARYVEWPQGLGYGRARIDDYGNRREVFAIIFEDSGGRPQYNLGYMHLWNTRAFGTDPDVIFGAGYMFMFMGRWDWNYLPIPLVFPVLSLGIGRLSVETTFVPGWEGYGNVIFTWIQLRL